MYSYSYIMYFFIRFVLILLFKLFLVNKMKTLLINPLVPTIHLFICLFVYLFIYCCCCCLLDDVESLLIDFNEYLMSIRKGWFNKRQSIVKRIYKKLRTRNDKKYFMIIKILIITINL